MNFGAYFGLLLAILYTGRHYYSQVFRRAVLIPTPETQASEAVWGARVFLICAGLFSVSLISVGLDWPLAVLYTVLIFMLFLVVGRLVAETGAFLVQAYWFPGVIVWGIFGARALGVKSVLIMLLLSSVMIIDPREAMMPFLVNAFKLLDLRRVKIGRTADLVRGRPFVVGLAVAVPATLAFQYDRGVDRDDAFAMVVASQRPFDKAIEVKERLRAQGDLAAAEATTRLEAVRRDIAQGALPDRVRGRAGGGACVCGASSALAEMAAAPGAVPGLEHVGRAGYGRLFPGRMADQGPGDPVRRSVVVPAAQAADVRADCRGAARRTRADGGSDSSTG